MPARAANLVFVTCSTVGNTGAAATSLAIGAAVSDYRPLSSLPDGSYVHYELSDTPGNETGWGYTSGGGTAISRNFIDSNTGSMLSLTGGALLVITPLNRDFNEVHSMNHALLGGI